LSGAITTDALVLDPMEEIYGSRVPIRFECFVSVKIFCTGHCMAVNIILNHSLFLAFLLKSLP
jgi:hypothetical protein